MRETQRSVDDVGVEHEEAGCNVASARILVVQSSDENGRRAGGILLVMYAAHREDRPLVLPELRRDHGVEPVFLDEPRVQNALDHGEELVRAGM